MKKLGRIWLFKLLIVSLLGIAILGADLFAQSDKNIFFLDRTSGEPEAVIKELEAQPDKDAAMLTQLGWLYFLYQNNLAKAKGYFTSALDKDPQNFSALDGMDIVYDYEGNEKSSLETAFQRISIDPESPQTEYLLRSLPYYDSWWFPPQKRLEFFSKLLEKPIQNKINETLIKESLMDIRFWLYGPEPEGFKLWRETGMIDKWLILGYFGPEGAACFDEMLPPEKEISLEKKYTVGEWEICWHKRQATKSNYHGFTTSYFLKPLENSGHCIYLLTYINAPTPRDAALRINSQRSSYRVWLNDQLIGEADRFSEYLPYRQTHGARLQAGWNKLLIKFIDPEVTSIRITDPAGAAFNDLTYETDFPNNQPPEITPSEGPLREVKVARGALDDLSEVIKDAHKKNISDYLGLMGLYLINGLQQPAFKTAEEVCQFHSQNAYFNYALGLLYKQNPFLPERKRLNLARVSFEQALKIDPQCLTAKQALAEYYKGKDKDKAIQYLKELIEANPHYLKAYQTLAELYAERKWEAEWVETLKAMEKNSPDEVQHLYAWASYYEAQKNYDQALACYQKIHKLTGTRYNYEELALREKRGDYDFVLAEYQKMLQDDPESVNTYNKLIEIYRKLKRYEEVEKVYARLQEIDPTNYRIYQEIGQFYYDWNKLDKAKEYWQKLLNVSHKYRVYQDDVRQYLNRTGDKEPDRQKQYEIDSQTLIKNAPGEKEYPQVGSIILLEQYFIRIYGDDLKSKETTVHKVIKILSKEAGERYGNLSITGQLVEARVYTKDGKILEPDPIQESSNQIRLPALDIGSILEIKYTTTDPFWFDDASDIKQILESPLLRREKEPLLRFRYIVDLPKQIKPDWKYHQYNFVPEVKEDIGTVTYLWDIKNMADYDPEAMMPEPNEVFPWLDFYRGRFSMEKLGRECRSQYLNYCIPDNVREKAQELITDSPTPEARIKAIYQFVVSEIKSGMGGFAFGGGHGDELLSHTLIEKEGNGMALCLAMLRAAGFEAYLALAQPRFNPGQNIEKEGPRFQLPIIYLPPQNGLKEIWLAPILQFQPYMSIPAQVQGGQAYVIMRDGTQIIDLPTAPFEENCSGALNFTIKLDSQGKAEVEGSIGFGGLQGAALRTMLQQQMNEQQRKNVVESVVGRILKGIQLTSHEFSEFQIDEAVMKINFSGTVPKFAPKTKKGFLKFKVVPRPLELTQNFLQKTDRKFALRLQMGSQVSTLDHITLTLPPNTRVELPENCLIWSEFGYYCLTLHLVEDTISIERRFSLVDQDIPVESYPRFADFCKKIEEAERVAINVYPKKTGD
jgi:pentatricopeptide repeat protein